MMRLGDVLLPGQVNLALEGSEKNDCVRRVAELLKGDARVSDFDVFVSAVMDRNAPAIEENGCGICIAHGRTQGVNSLVMAAGRLSEGIVSAETKSPIRLIFVAGIPSAFNSEYLRAIGAIARICCDKERLEGLLTVATPAEFIDLLSSGEKKL